MKIFDLFKKVREVLHLSDAEFENKIADFFELLSTDKKFTMLENGYWDLRAKHNVEIVIDEEDDEDEKISYDMYGLLLVAVTDYGTRGDRL